MAAGGATGAILRFLLTNLSKSIFSNTLYGTLCVNVLGSFFIGYFITAVYEKNIHESFIKFFLIIGLLGSFTTFSAFSFETVNLILSKKIFISLIYVFISIFICTLSAYLGMLINKF